MVTTAATERDGFDSAPEVRSPGFVGRNAELARLAAAFTHPPAVVLVEGEAGIGKSRLIREYLACPAARRHRVLVAACPPFRQPCTLGPVVDAARRATDDFRGLGMTALAGVLRPLFPEWADELPPLPEPLEDPTAARHRLYRALAELLGRLRVGVLVAEDVHWADEASVEFLLFLVTRQPQDISLVVTWRPEDVPAGSLLRRLSSRLPAGTSWERITLDPLDVSATAELVASMLPGGHVSAEFAKFLHAHTDGLPLAVEESVRLLRDRRDLRLRGTAWVRRHLDVLVVPPTVRDAVLERAAQLDTQAGVVLQAAAVLAAPWPESVLLSASGLTGEMGAHALSAALGCGLLAEEMLPYGRRLIAFRHVLAARAMYDAIPARQRRDFHARAARVLEGQSPQPVAQLARHFREADDAAAWCQYAEQAADQALAVGDQPTAASLLHDLVTEADLPAAVVVRLVRRIPLGALAEYASLAGLIGTLRSLLEDAALSRAERAEAGFQLGRLLVNAGEDEEGVAALERAVPGLAHRPADAARAMIMLGEPSRTLWTAAVHRRWLERGWVVAQDAAVGDDDRLVLAVNRAGALLDLGEIAGWAAADELPADASDPRQVLQVVRGLVNTGDAAIEWGRYGDARRRVGAALEVTERYVFPRVHDGILAQLAYLDWLTGAWSGLAERVAALAGDKEPAIHVAALLVGGLLDVTVGQYQSGEEKLQFVISDARQRGSIDYQAAPSASLARLRLAAGRVEDALGLTDEPMRVILAKRIWIWATDIVPVRIRALVTVGDVSRAAKLVVFFARGLGDRDAPAPQAALITCRATLAQARDQYRRAAALFGQAAEAWDRLPRPYEALLSRESQAACLLSDGLTDAGLALLTEVCRGLSRLEASGDVDRVEGSLREHGVKAWHGWRGGRRGYGGRLSPRELEVVRRAVAGRSVREIAEELCRSPGTVYTQLRSARRKLGVSSGTGLAVRAAETGAVTEGDVEHPS
jgi:DNA-binding CsgD family transcriptional regulator/tetratricopeptide (TPR) repeat protein